MISERLIEQTCVELLKIANTKLPPDIKEALEIAYEREDDDIPRMQLKTILENTVLAEERGVPICQDTGIPIFYVRLGREMPKDITRAIRNGVKRATEIIPLRPNVVHPITRYNPGTNLGRAVPCINYKMTNEDHTEIILLPKGAGSENMSAFLMLNPSQGIKGIEEFVLDTVANAGGKPCPPIILGIGIGGTADLCMKLAKEALLRPIDQSHPDKVFADLEKELLSMVNKIGIGPMGLGGKTTSLGVNIEWAHCHTASLPVAINIQCWAARRASAKIYSDGKVEYA